MDEGVPLKFGIFYASMVLEASQQDWDLGPERKALTNMLEQVRIGTRMGRLSPNGLGVAVKDQA